MALTQFGVGWPVQRRQEGGHVKNRGSAFQCSLYFLQLLIMSEQCPCLLKPQIILLRGLRGFESDNMVLFGLCEEILLYYYPWQTILISTEVSGNQELNEAAWTFQFPRLWNWRARPTSLAFVNPSISHKCHSAVDFSWSTRCPHDIPPKKLQQSRQQTPELDGIGFTMFYALCRQTHIASHKSKFLCIV